MVWYAAILRYRRFIVFSVFIFAIGTLTGAQWHLFINHLYQHNSNTVKKHKHSRFTTLATPKFDEYGSNTQNCKPKLNIFFLKTHKTAGSTVQNILLRHAERNNITVGLSSSKDFRFRYTQGEIFNRRFVRQSNSEINMLCHHMRFNKKEVESVLPKNTIYVTIIREPGELFASYFDYVHKDCPSFARVPQTTEGLQMWLNNPSRYFKGPESGLWWFAKNGLFFDFGYDNTNNDDEYIGKSVLEIAQSFHLVMISDYFDESVILLKDILCLDLRDVAHLQLNARSSSAVAVDGSCRQKIRKWDKADTALFDALNLTFWKKVEAFGKEKMKKEIKRLKKINLELQQNCIDGSRVVNSLVKDPKYRVYNPAGVQMTAFNLKEESKNNRTCQDVIKPEVRWFQYLFDKQIDNT